jgi:Mg-chelatase subunit ChlD
MTATEKLSEFDFIVVIDKSGSMGENDMPGGRSRWEYMQETAVAFCREMEKLDSDGLGVVLFSGSSIVSEDNVTSARIKEIFAANHPAGSTPLDQALEASLKLANKSNKKDFILVFTDGIPDDQERVKTIIRRQANSQDSDDALTFMFVQVGYDAGATKYLHSLDDELGTKFDIVCAMPISEAEKFASTAEMVIHAIEN